jgi:hypothetical protein
MGDTHVGLQARLMSQALRKLSGAISKSNTTAIFINQVSGLPNITPTFSRIWLMKIAVVFDLEIAPESLRNACDIKRACKPTWL